MMVIQRLGLVVTGAILGGVLFAAPVPVGNFEKVVEISFPGFISEAESLSNFPMPIVLDSSVITGFSYTDCTAGAFVFSDENDNEIPHEVDKWDASGKSFLWVKVPTLAKGKIIKLYYKLVNGKTFTPSTVSTDVWSEYLAVWHMNDSGITGVADSTGNGHSLTPTTAKNKLSAVASSKFGSAVKFSKENQGYTANSLRTVLEGKTALAMESLWTVNSWGDNGENKMVCFRNETGSNDDIYLAWQFQGKTWRPQLQIRQDSQTATEKNNALTYRWFGMENKAIFDDKLKQGEANWYTASFSLEKDTENNTENAKLLHYVNKFRNRQSNGEDFVVSPWTSFHSDTETADREFCIGLRMQGSSSKQGWNGNIDELRISTTAGRTPLWHETFNDTLMVANYISYGAAVAVDLGDDPTGTLSVESVGVTDAHFAFMATSLGSETAVAVKLELSENADFSNAVVYEPTDWQSLSTTGVLTPVFTVNNLQHGTTYYARASFEDVVFTELDFTTLTPGTPTYTSSITRTRVDEVLVSVDLTNLGEYSQSMAVYFDYSLNEDFSGAVSTLIAPALTEATTLTDVSCVIPADPMQVYARVRLVNNFGVQTSFDSIILNKGPAFSVDTAPVAASAPVFLITVDEPGFASSVVKAIVSVYRGDVFVGSQETVLDLTEFPCSVEGLVKPKLDFATDYTFVVTLQNAEGFTTSSAPFAWTTPATLNGDNVWANTGTDLTADSSYIYPTAPDASHTAYFETASATSPVVDDDVNAPALYFGRKGNNPTADDHYIAYGYDVTGAGTLAISATDAVIQRSAGTNTISTALHLTATTPKINTKVGDLYLKGPLTFGERTTSVKFGAWNYGITHLDCETPGYNGKLEFEVGDAGCIAWENPLAFKDITYLKLPANWGGGDSTGNYTGRTLPNWGIENADDRRKTAAFYNKTCSPLIFASVETVWFGGEGVIFSGDGFEFPNAELNGDTQNPLYVMCDLTVKDCYSRESRLFSMKGNGLLTLLESMRESASPANDYVRVDGGCFYPATTNGWGYYKCVSLNGGTIGIAENYTARLDGTHTYKVLGVGDKEWGWTAISGNPEVQIIGLDNEPYVITTATGVPYAADEEHNITVNGALLNTFNILPKALHFGNRSAKATGTILFKNKINLETATDYYIYCENAPHIVAARMMEPVVLQSGKSLKLYATGNGGTIAFEKGCVMPQKVVINDKLTALFNDYFTIESGIDVENGGSLGGTGTITNSVNLKSGATTLIGGERGKGGVLTIVNNGLLNFNEGASIKIEVPGMSTRPEDVGSVRLLGGDKNNKKELRKPNTGKISVVLDVSNPRASGTVKVLDWSAAYYNKTFELDDFEIVYDPEYFAEPPILFVEDNVLYAKFKGAKCKGLLIILR